MSDPIKQKAFSAMMCELFRLPGQALQAFALELRELTQEDKEWYHLELLKEGHDCLPPNKPIVQV
jgi:hypothetical protein